MQLFPLYSIPTHLPHFVNVFVVYEERNETLTKARLHGYMQSGACVAGCVKVSWSLLVHITGLAGASL